MKEERKYTIRTSAHGSGYVPNNPELFDMTLLQATRAAHDWESYADTVGGRAIVVENINGVVTEVDTANVGYKWSPGDKNIFINEKRD